jgi:hypothetical protein
VTWINLLLGITFGVGVGLVLASGPISRSMQLIAGTMARTAAALEATAQCVERVARALERAAERSNT